jgi:hypothetical protein
VALTRDFKKTVVARVERGPAFAKALLDEGVTLFLSGKAEMARLFLRDLVNAVILHDCPLNAIPAHVLTKEKRHDDGVHQIVDLIE